MERQRVASTNLASVGYDAKTAVLEVEFVNGRVYQYYAVPNDVHTELMQASSKGQFFNHEIKGSYPFSRVD